MMFGKMKCDKVILVLKYQTSKCKSVSNSSNVDEILTKTICLKFSQHMA